MPLVVHSGEQDLNLHDALPPKQVACQLAHPP
jgi:hypothetical protein